MRRSSLLSAAAFVLALLVVGAPRPAAAVLPVFDPLMYAKQLVQIEQDGQRYETQTQMLAQLFAQLQNMVVNGHVNIDEIWQSITPDLQQLDQVLAGNNALDIRSKDLLAQFQAEYPNFTPSQPIGDLLSMYQDYTKKSIGNTLLFIQAQDKSLASQSLTMRKLEQLAVGARGRMDALQVANMIASQQVYATDRLHRTIMAQAQEESSYFMDQIASKAAESNQATNALAAETFQRANDIAAGRMPASTGAGR